MYHYVITGSRDGSERLYIAVGAEESAWYSGIGVGYCRFACLRRPFTESVIELLDYLAE